MWWKPPARPVPPGPGGMGYESTRRADQDIVDRYVYSVDRHGLDQAERYLRALLDAFDLLTRNPYVARERSEFSPPVRIQPFNAHVIVYTVSDDGMLIVRVLHGRQDWQRDL